MHDPRMRISVPETGMAAMLVRTDTDKTRRGPSGRPRIWKWIKLGRTQMYVEIHLCILVYGSNPDTPDDEGRDG